MVGVKHLLLGPAAVLLSLGVLPVVLAGGDAPPIEACAYGVDVELVLATIRSLESGDDYTAEAAGSTASGAYQFLDSTWDGYGGYTRALGAPAEVQDERARVLVNDILEEHAGDVSTIPVVWYIGHVPNDGSSEWDEVPSPDAGNQLTPREYQQQWLTKFADLKQTIAEDPVSTWTPCTGASVAQIAPGWALPGPHDLIVADPAALAAPHHDYPAWDWIIPTGTPIYAIRGGKVTRVSNWPYNWWEYGCGAEGGRDCRSCGVGVTVTDDQGTRWTYCHGSALTIALGSQVIAGEQLVWSGNTGRSGTPHLHLEIRTSGDVRRCPQPLLVALTHGEAPELGALPTSGCNF
jgi:hypothetical protein